VPIRGREGDVPLGWGAEPAEVAGLAGLFAQSGIRGRWCDRLEPVKGKVGEVRSSMAAGAIALEGGLSGTRLGR
jgi:hypothetical protein